ADQEIARRAEGEARGAELDAAEGRAFEEPSPDRRPAAWVEAMKNFRGGRDSSKRARPGFSDEDVPCGIDDQAGNASVRRVVGSPQHRPGRSGEASRGQRRQLPRVRRDAGDEDLARGVEGERLTAAVDGAAIQHPAPEIAAAGTRELDHNEPE